MKFDLSHINQLIDLQRWLYNEHYSEKDKIDKLIAVGSTMTRADAVVVFVSNLQHDVQQFESLHLKTRQNFSQRSQTINYIRDLLQAAEQDDTTSPFEGDLEYYKSDTQLKAVEPSPFTYSITAITYSDVAARLVFIWGAAQKIADAETQFLQRLIAYFATLYEQLDVQRVSSHQEKTQSRIKPKDAPMAPQEYLGSSFETKKLLAIADRVAATDASVLIYGESGVGKEVLAERMYRNSLRVHKSFIKLNCAAIPEHLLESELFGHKKGAFTNALYDRKGKFLIADSGTLFLDEIAELSLPLQAKILRVLQNKTFEPVGSDEELRVDVRIIAATNKDLQELVQQGLFREDLYYRLHVIPVYIPPLRERREEILELAEYFLTIQKHTLHQEQILGFSDHCKQALQDYGWPGNVRELQNLVQRGIILTEGRFIETDHLFSQKESGTQQDSVLSQSLNASQTSDLTALEELLHTQKPLKTKIDLCKRLIIENQLRYNKWNQSETAKQLDIQRTYLSRLIKELHIQRE